MFKNVSVKVMMCLLVIACNTNAKPKKPDNLISKDKMSEVLYDLYIINAAKGVNKKVLKANGFMPETYVLTKHNIDSTQFADSNMYYAFDIDVYEAIVDKVKARLEKEKLEFVELEKAEGKVAKFKRDSINKLRIKNRDTTVKQKKKILNKISDSTVIN
jgi:hypothetical protein